LQEALAGEGVDTEIVQESSLPTLPQTQFVTRLQCLPEGLVIYDQLGRSSATQWTGIRLIAAGEVSLTEFNRVRKVIAVPRYDPYTETIQYETEVDFISKEQRQ